MTTATVGRRTFAVIDGAALRENFVRVRAAVGPSASVLAVVKADAYGHGATLVAPILEASGADWFGVATVDEGVELRQAGVRKPILVLTGATPGELPAIEEHRLSIAILHRDMARELAAANRRRPLRVHLKVDTGMGRVGVLPNEVPLLFEELRAANTFELEGIFSHFANADRIDCDYSDYQLKVFLQVLERVAATGQRPMWIHMANSAATLARPDSHLSMVRPGIILYGVSPSTVPVPAGVRPVMRLVTHILELKAVPSEFPISYGQTFVTRRPSLIATLPVGYADGYSRALSNRAAVLVGGQRAPVIGAVCMDLTMVDVTDIPGVQVGDEVVLWGAQNGAEIGVREVAEWQGTVAYEVLTRLGKRVPRVLQA